MRVPEPAESFVLRIDQVRERLARLAFLPSPEGLTDPDVQSGERWTWGQVWGHLAEFPGYWIEQFERVVEAPSDRPASFGRTQEDPARVGAIEGGRITPITELWERLTDQLDRAKAFVTGLSEEDWRARGEHVRRGVMDVPHMVEQFVVGHLEEHADQLEHLAGHGSAGEA